MPWTELDATGRLTIASDGIAVVAVEDAVVVTVVVPMRALLDMAARAEPHCAVGTAPVVAMTSAWPTVVGAGAWTLTTPPSPVAM
jgi:hypothetical protein